MQEVNRLGLRVVGITAVVVLVLFGLYWGGRALLRRGEDGPSSPINLADRQKDSDNDGVADLYETSYYNTDPSNSDTDGDGVSDLDEILAGTDPTIPGPADVSKPATGSQITQQNTLTQKYLASLPDDIPRAEILNQVRLEAFIDANRGELLPNVAAAEVTTSAAQGAAAIEAYLEQISSDHNEAITAITSSDIEAAWRLQVNSSQPQPMRDLVAALETNVQVLEGVTAPTEVVGLHTQFVAASRALRDNAAALRDIQQDFVRGLVAAKNIESLGAVFQDIAGQIQALEAKYGLE